MKKNKKPFASFYEVLQLILSFIVYIYFCKYTLCPLLKFNFNISYMFVLRYYCILIILFFSIKSTFNRRRKIKNLFFNTIGFLFRSLIIAFIFQIFLVMTKELIKYFLNP